MTEPGAIDALPRRTAHALDLLAFSLADVRDGLGPYLSIYLLLTHHWDQASIGLVMAVGGIAGVVAQTPVGALVDRTTAKRALVIVGAVAVAVAALAMPLFPGFHTISFLQAVTGIAGSIFNPAIAAITLGIVGPRLFSIRVGRNESFRHAGTASAAAAAGGLAYFLGPVVVFWLLAGMAVISVVATLRVPHDAIDNDVARGMDKAIGEPHKQPSGFAVLLHNRRLTIFAVVVFAIFLIAFAVLAVRAFLYPLSDNSYWLVGVQLLDGIGAGIFGALFPLVVQDVTHGTGRFNVSLGAITTAWGVGAALSNFVAGGIVVAAGYGIAFMLLGAIAGVGFALYLIAMPETVARAGHVPEHL